MNQPTNKGNLMRKPLAVIALCAGMLALGACDKTPTTAPATSIDTPTPPGPVATMGSASDPSVPSATSVFPAVSGAQADSTQGRSNKTMSTAQESTAMPLPGQNNDHSAPVGPGKRASAP